jgi:CTP:phosphocholine cytidylyltransferase-like protein
MIYRHLSFFRLFTYHDEDVLKSALEIIFDVLTQHPKSYWKEQFECYQRKIKIQTQPLSKNEIKALDKVVEVISQKQNAINNSNV